MPVSSQRSDLELRPGCARFLPQHRIRCDAHELRLVGALGAAARFRGPFSGHKRAAWKAGQDDQGAGEQPALRPGPLMRSLMIRRHVAAGRRRSRRGRRGARRDRRDGRTRCGVAAAVQYRARTYRAGTAGVVGALAAPVADIPVVIRVAFVADAFLDVDHLLAPVSRIPVRPVALLEEQAPLRHDVAHRLHLERGSELAGSHCARGFSAVRRGIGPRGMTQREQREHARTCPHVTTRPAVTTHGRGTVVDPATEQCA